MAGLDEEAGSHERVENATADRVIQVPQPHGLRNRERETWHLEKLASHQPLDRASRIASLLNLFDLSEPSHAESDDGPRLPCRPMTSPDPLRENRHLSR